MRRNGWDLAAAGTALLLPLLNLVFLAGAAWAGRYVLVVGLGVLGVPLAVLAARRNAGPDVVAAAGFLGWAVLSTALSNVPVASFWGGFGQGAGLLFVSALVSCYLMARRCSEEGRRTVELAMVAAVSINGMVAIAQAAFDLSRANVGALAGRSPALLGNPVFAGMLFAGGFWLCLPRLSRRPGLIPLTGAVVSVAGAQLSGSRAAILSIAVAAVASARFGRWRFIWSLGALVLGLGLASTAAWAGGQGAAAESSALARLDGGTGGLTPRLEAWRSGLDAFAESPLLGVGPGRFAAGTIRHRTLAFVHSEGPDTYFADAHNVVVEYLATMGIVGLGLLVAWIGLALRRSSSRSPLVGFAIGAFLVHLAEPQMVGVTPLMFIALGAAGSSERVGSQPERWLLGGMIAAAAGVAGTIAVGLWWLNQASLDFNLADARRAERILPFSQAPEQVARVHILKARERNLPLPMAALEARERAADLDPEDSRRLGILADFQYQLGQRDRARQTFDRVLALDRWRRDALNARARLAFDAGDYDLAHELLSRSLLVDPDQEDVIRFDALVRGRS